MGILHATTYAENQNKDEEDLIRNIDTVLEYINRIGMPPFQSFAQIHLGLHGDIASKSLIEILNKLEKDNTVYSEINADNIRVYYSTFEGQLLEKRHGYAALYKSLDEEKYWKDYLEKQSLKNSVRLNYLTAILGIGAVAVAIPEAMNIYLRSQKEFLIYVCLLAISTIVILLVLKSKEKPNKPLSNN